MKQRRSTRHTTVKMEYIEEEREDDRDFDPCRVKNEETEEQIGWCLDLYFSLNTEGHESNFFSSHLISFSIYSVRESYF